ncbi:beta-galactosidase [Paenibacillus sacheonensis]|uniref:Glycoside hydrolase family 42 N-terminal domain-containing protein n=1 Tax=Paenibacillus sacheonensis TaxID=742054 RepID=A0A7X4YJG9_9BACL|nr:beta-galactosidase [Paenibacillus sacheonensis]MBM7564132.1 hypothetical protein [Paenibacillus sacheonensis]NBC67538.1 hypothetical protein [Paenibacillus sacheonensis]
MGEKNQALRALLQPEARGRMSGPMAYFGYFGGNGRDELAEMEEEGVNCSSPNNVIYIPELDAEGNQRDPYEMGSERARQFREQFAATGLSFDICLGAWNNGLFPYLPQWYLEAHPDLAVKDQHGEPIMASMHGHYKPWAGTECAAYNEEIDAFVRGFVDAFGEHERMAYWVTGGEMLYPTYVFPDRHSDYSAAAQDHYRAWLTRKYGTVQALREAWGDRGEGIDGFEAAVPAAWDERSARGLDWHAFRMDALSEYFQRQYITFLASDSPYPLLAILHGDMFHERTYAEMGQSVYGMSAVSDGLATSQILFNAHKPDFNHMYLQFITSLGKPATSQALACVSPPIGEQVVNNSFTPQDVRRAVYECLGMGIWHAGLVQWKGDLPDGNWQVAGTPAQEEVRLLAAELDAMKPELAGMARLAPALGILYSEAALLLDGWQEEWTLLHRATIDAHVPYVTLFDQSLDRQLGALPDGVSYGPDAIGSVIVPYASALRTDAADKLLRFVAQGGKLVLFDDAEQLRTAAAHAELGWSDPFAALAPSFSPADPAKRFRTAEARYGEGEVLWVRSSYNRLFLQRIFYAQETLVTQMWQHALAWLGRRGYAKPLAGAPVGTESFVLTDGEHAACVFINRTGEEVAFEATISDRLGFAGGSAEPLSAAGKPAQPLGEDGTFAVKLDGFGTGVYKLRGIETPAGAQESEWSIELVEAGPECLRVRVMRGGQPDASASVSARVAPLFDAEAPVFGVGEGEFAIGLERASLPGVYDYRARAYAPYEGVLRVHVGASDSRGRIAACRTVKLEATGR